MSLTSRIRPLHLVVSISLLAACRTDVGRPVAAALPGHDVALAAEAPQTSLFEGFVPANATFDMLLRQADVPAELTPALVTAARTVFDPRDLRADRPYQIVRTIDGLFREFRYQIDADNVLRVSLHSGDASSVSSVDAAVVALPKEYHLDAVSAEITERRTSLIEAFSDLGENIQLPLQLADVFAGELDFNSDLRRGDRVDALFERATRDGQFVGYGTVKAAILKTGSRLVKAVQFPGPDGKPAWYDEAGRSLRRAFLKSPLPFDPRVTSAFSSNRLHPLFGIERPHLGVDFGAPYGTAVRSVAAGTVEVAAFAGEAGRMVRIRHAGGYETAYLHLSSFAAGVRPGAHVEQGQLIGRVGQTGAATGPHLDFRVIRKGIYVNPLTEFSRMPHGDPLGPDDLARFAQVRDEALHELADKLQQ